MDCDDEHMTSEAGVIERLEREGFIEHFVVKDGALRSGSGATFAPPDVTIRQFGRYEGVSNPSDESVIYAIESRDGVRGTLVDAFGAYADPRSPPSSAPCGRSERSSSRTSARRPARRPRAPTVAADLLGGQPVADAGLGQQIARARRLGLELVPQVGHVHAHVVRLVVVGRAPHLAQ